MTETRHVRVTLTEDQVAAVKEAVASGEYASTSEVVGEAIRDWQLRRALRPEEAETLRSLWDEGKASGSPRLLDFSELRREGRRQLGAIKKTGGPGPCRRIEIALFFASRNAGNNSINFWPVH